MPWLAPLLFCPWARAFTVSWTNEVGFYYLVQYWSTRSYRAWEGFLATFVYNGSPLAIDIMIASALLVVGELHRDFFHLSYLLWDSKILSRTSNANLWCLLLLSMADTPWAGSRLVWCVLPPKNLLSTRSHLSALSHYHLRWSWNFTAFLVQLIWFVAIVQNTPPTAMMMIHTRRVGRGEFKVSLSKDPCNSP